MTRTGQMQPSRSAFSTYSALRIVGTDLCVRPSMFKNNPVFAIWDTDLPGAVASRSPHRSGRLFKLDVSHFECQEFLQLHNPGRNGATLTY